MFLIVDMAGQGENNTDFSAPDGKPVQTNNQTSPMRSSGDSGLGRSGMEGAPQVVSKD